MKIWKIWPKFMLYTSKESLEEVECRFRLKEYDLLTNFYHFLGSEEGLRWFKKYIGSIRIAHKEILSNVQNS